MITTLYLYAVKAQNTKNFRFLVLERKLSYVNPAHYSEYKLIAEIPIEDESELTGYYNEYTQATEFTKVQEVTSLFASYRTKEAVIELMKPYANELKTENPLFS